MCLHERRPWPLMSVCGLTCKQRKSLWWAKSARTRLDKSRPARTPSWLEHRGDRRGHVPEAGRTKEKTGGWERKGARASSGVSVSRSPSHHKGEGVRRGVTWAGRRGRPRERQTGGGVERGVPSLGGVGRDGSGRPRNGAARRRLVQDGASRRDLETSVVRGLTLEMRSSSGLVSAARASNSLGLGARRLGGRCTRTSQANPQDTVM